MYVSNIREIVLYMDTVLMIILAVFLAFTILFKAQIVDDRAHFFDLNNSKAMRGFWCLIVILIHVPQDYSNFIQSTIACFAYIGVTFFFMTSSFGLTLGMEKKPEKIRTFWRQRLPKLVITCWIINIISSLLYWYLYDIKVTLLSLLAINKWVLWLLVCYFAFWAAHILFYKNKCVMNGFIVSFIVLFSLVVYFLVKYDLYHSTIWSVEMYGFIWGLLLALLLAKFYDYFKGKWFVKLAAVCVISLILGVCYLKFKIIPFYGDFLLKILLGFFITVFVLISNVRISYGNKVSYFLGDISFEVYLLHYWVFGLVNSLSGGNLSSSEFILVSIVGTVVFAVIVHYLVTLIMKPVNKFIKRSCKN